MADEFQSGICSGHWWNSSRNGLNGSGSVPCSTTVNDIGNFGGWSTTEVVDMKTRSCEESVSVSDSSMVYQDTQKPQGSDSVSGGGGGNNVLMDSTLQMMGFGLSTPLDWNQALLSRNSGRAENNFHSLLQEELSSRSNYTQENMMESSQVQKNWSPQNFSGSSAESSVAFKQINQGLSLDQNRTNTGNSGSDACTVTCQGLPTDFSMDSVPYNYQPTFLQGILEPDLHLQQSPYQNRTMNYTSQANYGVNTNELSHSWQKLPQYMKASPPTQHSSTNNHLHFSNNAPYWNPAAASMSTRPSFLPSVQNQMFAQTLEEKPNCSTSAKPKSNEVRDSGSAVKKGSSDTAPKRPRVETPSPLPTFKVRKEKLGDRVTALQQLVSPFGKTDTASVLYEAIDYIKFLHEQVSVLSAPYMKNGAPVQHHQNSDKAKGAERPQQDLRSRGLCLVPMSSIFSVTNETSADFWTPTFGGTYR
ncbi:hypothetical protein IFM89_008661 [Coptis chinensis]|uniref:BHLH domain-containing protein n=1 Tax=Coptis chinensis TaxID=261450 RepID=A0A835LDY3_9MAGN|nr:hypothetical protein IFM89_008661 [Coptis chinensis]